MKLILLCVVSFFSVSLFASPGLGGRQINIAYSDGQSYRLDFQNVEVTWQGTKGFDAGKSEKEKYQSIEVAPEVFLIHWTESDGSFVDLVLNFVTNHAYSSGQSGRDQWFRQGILSPK